jgi:hypothetical protein
MRSRTPQTHILLPAGEGRRRGGLADLRELQTRVREHIEREEAVLEMGRRAMLQMATGRYP